MEAFKPKHILGTEGVFFSIVGGEDGQKCEYLYSPFLLSVKLCLHLVFIYQAKCFKEHGEHFAPWRPGFLDSTFSATNGQPSIS